MTKGPGLKYQLVARQLLDYISELEEGSKLPNRNALASHFGVARTTLEHAIADLIAQRYLVARDGSGTYVASRQGPEAPPDQASQRWLRLKADMGPLRANSWALLLSNILYDIYPNILRAVQDVASQHDINLIVSNTDNSIPQQEDIMHRLALSGTSGMIVVPAIGGQGNPLALPALLDSGIRIVSCFRPLDMRSVPGVYGNSCQAGHIGTRHLMAQGCQRIAFLSSPMYQGAYERYQGYLTALSEAGEGAQQPLLSCEDIFHYERGIPAAERLLDEHSEIDGIFAFNDRVAREAYQALRKRGREPGRDVLIVSCDNTGICDQLSPRLSSVAYPLHDIGRASAQMLWQLVSGERPPQDLSVYGCSLVTRASSTRS